MTVENSKRLYLHYLEVKNDKAAKDMLKKYPEFEVKKEKKSGRVQSKKG
jgi:hypothetical protein